MPILARLGVTFRVCLPRTWITTAFRVPAPCYFHESATDRAGDDLPKTQPVSDKPIQYSSSRAFLHKVVDITDEGPSKIQNYIMVGSMAVFMIYFFILREENDLDELIYAPIWDKVPGLEKQTLVALIQQQKKEGLSTALAESRLAQLKLAEIASIPPADPKPFPDTVPVPVPVVNKKQANMVRVSP